MIYELLMKNTNGTIIYQSVQNNLDAIMTIRQALISRFVDNNEWHGDFIAEIIVSVTTADAKEVIELADLRVELA